MAVNKKCKIANYFNDSNYPVNERSKYCLNNCTLNCLEVNSLLSLNDRLSLPTHLFIAIQCLYKKRGFKKCN